VRIAYVVLGHREPDQIFRLFGRLDDGVRILHYDAKAPDQQLVRECAAVEGVLLAPARRVHWGGWSSIEATLASLRVAAAHDVDYAVLLSGQDYPLTAAAARHRALERLEGRTAMRHLPLPVAHWPGNGGLDRIRRVHVRVPLMSGPRSMVRLPLRRRVPDGIAPHGGLHWSAFSREAIAHLTGLDARDPVRRLYRHALIPDEGFFQTALVNSPLRDRLDGEGLHYTVFDGWHPRVLREADLPALRESAKLFARKFDARVDAAVLDALDRAA
jgi:hypothetical protein